MGKVAALMAGEKLSAQEVLVEALGACQEGKIKSVVILALGDDDVPDVTCSSISVRDLALLHLLMSDFATEVARGLYLNEEE